MSTATRRQRLVHRQVRRRRSGGCPSCRRAPARTPGRARCRHPRRVWCWSMCRSPSRVTVRSIRRVAGEQLQHVVEEADAGRDRRPARAVEAEADRDVGLGGLARNARGTHGLSPSASGRRGLRRRLLATRVPGRHSCRTCARGSRGRPADVAAEGFGPRTSARRPTRLVIGRMSPTCEAPMAGSSTDDT